MNYKESSEILKLVKKAKKIVVNLHRSPDPDSFSSGLSLYRVLRQMDKQVDVICTSSSSFMKEVSFLFGFKDIRSVDFEKFDFTEYDLLISPDSAEWQQVVDSDKIPLSKIDIAVIDHHHTNNSFGKINLIDADQNSTAEILLKVFEDWEINIDPDSATLLLTGIIGDTGGFQFPGTAKSLELASKLIAKGADMNKIMFNIFRNKEFNAVKMIGEFLNTMQIDKVGNFVYMAIPYEIYAKYGRPTKISTYVANVYSNLIEGTRFGVTIIESLENNINVSFRSRGDFDVSKIAVDLDGGGHKVSAAANLKDISFDKAIEKILEVSRKHVKKSS